VQREPRVRARAHDHAQVGWREAQQLVDELHRGLPAHRLEFVQEQHRAATAARHRVEPQAQVGHGRIGRAIPMAVHGGLQVREQVQRVVVARVQRQPVARGAGLARQLREQLAHERGLAVARRGAQQQHAPVRRLLQQGQQLVTRDAAGRQPGGVELPFQRHAGGRSWGGRHGGIAHECSQRHPPRPAAPWKGRATMPRSL